MCNSKTIVRENFYSKEDVNFLGIEKIKKDEILKIGGYVLRQNRIKTIIYTELLQNDDYNEFYNSSEKESFKKNWINTKLTIYDLDTLRLSKQLFKNIIKAYFYCKELDFKPNVKIVQNKVIVYYIYSKKNNKKVVNRFTKIDINHLNKGKKAAFNHFKNEISKLMDDYNKLFNQVVIDSKLNGYDNKKNKVFNDLAIQNKFNVTINNKLFELNKILAIWAKMNCNNSFNSKTYQICTGVDLLYLKLLEIIEDINLIEEYLNKKALRLKIGLKYQFLVDIINKLILLKNRIKLILLELNSYIKVDKVIINYINNN